MRIRHALIPALLGLVVPLAAPASAAPACFVTNWSNGDSCYFEAPAGAFLFGGTATAGDGQQAWIAVEVLFQGVVIDSCYGSGTTVATCEDYGQAFAPNFTHECRVHGTGGPKFHCADPPALPLPLR